MKNRKILSVLLVFAMLITLIAPLVIVPVSAATTITNQSGLAGISSNLSGSYELSNDITISGTWTGITGFTGTLDGKGHTITIADGATVSGGLFQLLNNGATVKNLNIAQAGSATYTLVKPNGSGAYCFGMVAACLAAGSDFNNTAVTQNTSNRITIENVRVTANMTFSDDGNTNVSIGGIAGETGIISTFENCVFNGSITDNGNRSGRDMNTYQSGHGGIVGQAIRTGGPVTINQCINYASITGCANEGGILGHSRSWGGGSTALKALVITKCANFGTITCTQTTTGSDKRATAGGIVGYAMIKSADSSYATITNNINYGDVTGAGTGEYAYVAGIFACINVSGTATISGNINYGTLSGGHSSYRNNFYTKKDGSGTITAANNYANPTESTVSTLNAAYPGVYVFKDNQVKLAWTEADYVMITDQASFVSAIATNSVKDNDGKALGKFKLANDITISGAWSFTTIFRGELDGDGHTVTFADGATVDSGLFRVLGANAYIHDLKIEQTGTVTWTLNPDLPGRANACLGGVAGLATAGNVNGTNVMNTESFISNASNKVRIENVTVTARMNVAGSGNNISVGGIIGEVAIYTEITNCEFNGYITDTVEHSGTSNQDGGSKRVGYGGIVGFGIRPAVLVITECINNGDISGYGNEGGILGAASPGWDASLALKTTTIQRCINNGTITCNLTTNAGSAGGIAGYLYGRRTAGARVNVLNNINKGTIAKASGNAYTAGIVARVNRKTNVNVVTLAGNLQLSDNIVGGQIVQQTDGDGDSGVLVFANNYGRGDGNATYSALPDVAAYETAYTTLNAAYPGVYEFKNNKLKLAWWIDPEAEVEGYVMITDQASFISEIATNSTKDSDGKATGKFKLANDITISGSWSFTTIFRGELDGDGHTITFADGATVDSGLFQVLGANAYIHDLKIAQTGTVTWTLNPDLPGRANACLGGVAGLATAGNVNGTNVMNTESFISNASNKVRIENVTVTANMNVAGDATNISVGGIIGEVAIYTEITNCEFNGYITDTVEHSGTSNQDGGSKRVGYGGIVGFGIRPAVLVITECINNGDISGYGHEGGILGAASPGWDASLALKTTTIQRCINNGKITCKLTTNAGSVGGIAGYLYGRRSSGATVNVLNNINYGTIAKADGNAYIAGIAARVNRKTNVNVVTLAGNVQLSGNIGGGGQIVQQTDGDGDAGVLVFANNYGRGDGNNGTYAPLSDVAAYEPACTALNAVYSGVYSYKSNKIKLTWAISFENSGGTKPTGSLERNEISNQADLALLPQTGSYTLINDITIRGNWNYSDAFMGTLNGNGHTITFADGATVNGGLFKTLNQGATIRNLNIVAGNGVTWKLAADIVGGSNAGAGAPCAGGLAASAEAGIVDGVKKWEDATFISNVSNIITIQNVTVSANIAISGSTGGNDMAAVGGIIGDVGIICTIQNCVFSGSISDVSRSYVDMSAYQSGYGGIVGVTIRDGGPVQIIECINNGNISGYGQQGGILGSSRTWSGGSVGLASLIIQRCINNGTITTNRIDTVDSTHYSTAGGIAGYIYVKNAGTASVLNNVNNGDVITQVVNPESNIVSYAGGIVGILRRGADDAFEISGNASRQGSVKAGGIEGGRYYGKDNGSGTLVYVNNMGFGATSSGIATALAVLNPLYSNRFAAGKNYTLTMTWVNNKGAYLDESNYQKLFSLGLDGIIQLRIGVAVPGDIPSSLRLVVSKGNEELQNVQMSEVYDVESGYYVVSVPILAKEMASANTYTMSVQNGGVTIWSTSQSISVKNYVAALKTHSEYSAWFELADAMLKYGAAAQNLFGYQIGSLAADISGGISVDTSSLPSATVSGDRSFLTQIRGSLSLEAGTDLNFYFKPKTPGTNLTATVRKNNAVVSSGVETEWVADENGTENVFLAVRVLGLAADELDDWYDIIVTDGSKSVTVHYSGLCWAKVILNDSTASAASKTLAKGIVLYSNKANACVGNVEPIVIANANSTSQYYISYPSGADTYLKSEILSYATKMNQKGIYIATAAGTKSLGKPITVTTNSSITGFQITFAANGNITVTGKDYLMAQNGFHYLVDTMITRTSDGSYIIANPTNVSNTASAYTRSGWLLATPAYENGTLASALYDEGTGLATDEGTTVNGERSYAMYIRSTNATQFNAYASKLVSNGYTLDASNSFAAKSNGSSLFKTYRRGTQVLFLYFDATNGAARVIDDLVSTPESEFEYTFSYTSSTSTDLVLYGLKYNSQGYSPSESSGDPTIANNGALIIIKQADGSLMLIDGGLYLQGTDTAVEGLWNYLHSLTGKAAGTNITVSCWYITHPHADHYYLVSALLEKYHDKIDLQRVMFNFPKFVTDKGYDEDIRFMARAYYPNVKFMKCHTGQSIQLGSLKLDVMATHEDLVNTTSGAVSFDAGNDMTTMLRITFPDGSRFMSMGDATEDVVISGAISRLAASELSCKFFDVPHHGYNELSSSQCKVFKPTYVFFPNANYSGFPSSVLNDKRWRYNHCKNNHDYLQSAGASYFYYAGSGTYKLTISNGSVSVTSSSLVP